MKLLRVNRDPLDLDINSINRIISDNGILQVHLNNGEKLLGYMIKNY